jgi:CHAD domain-containing protein
LTDVAHEPIADSDEFTCLLQLSSSMPKPAGPFEPLRKRLDAFTKEAKHIYEEDVEALHLTRVASRRLRELLPVLGLDGETASKLGRRLRKVTRQLGVVRELDVLLLMIRELCQKSHYSTAALKQVGAGVERERAAAAARLSRKLPLEKMQRLAHRLERTARHLESAGERTAGRTGHTPKQAWIWALEARLARRAARVRSAIDGAGTVYVPERLHEVRIALKKLRYAAELDAETRHERPSSDIATLKAAQDHLGRLHDLEVLMGRARGEQALQSPPDLTAWHDLESLVHGVENECRSLHARYMHGRARLLAIADRMGSVTLHGVFARRRAVS